jgi:hypothetical protein
MKSAIVHQYFKKELDEFTILLQVDPIHYEGVELIKYKDGRLQKTERQLDEDIFDDLAADGFTSASPLEFNIYLKGLAPGI